MDTQTERGKDRAGSGREEKKEGDQGGGRDETEEKENEFCYYLTCSYTHMLGYNTHICTHTHTHTHTHQHDPDPVPAPDGRAV